MERNKANRVSIEIYDADGELCECIGGQMDYEEIRERMIDALKNDGIPVIRRHAKHAPVDEEKKKKDFHDLGMMMTECIKDWGKNKPMMHVCGDEIVPLPIPRVLTYEFDGIKFRAAGHAEDVHKANEALLKRVFEE